MRRLLAALVVLTFVSGPAVVAGAADTTMGQKVGDAEVLAKVKTKLAAEKIQNLVHVNVDVKNGVVELKGSVPTEADKARAAELAQATEGVREVRNGLVVSSPSASPSTK